MSARPCINDHVTISSQTGKVLRGIVRFVGATQFAAGDWVGVELRLKQGRNDGSVQDVRYFSCATGYGLFVRPEAITIGGPSLKEAPRTSVSALKKQDVIPHQREITKMIAAGAAKGTGSVRRPMATIPSVTVLDLQGDLTKWARFRTCDNSVAKTSEVSSSMGTSEVKPITIAVPDEAISPPSTGEGHARSDTISSDESFLITSGRSSNASVNSTCSTNASIDSIGSLLVCSLSPQDSDEIREELAQQEIQAKKLRSSVARRRTHAGANCSNQDVERILTHYEKCLADTEARIEMLRRTLGIVKSLV